MGFSEFAYGFWVFPMYKLVDYGNAFFFFFFLGKYYNFPFSLIAEEYEFLAKFAQQNIFLGKYSVASTHLNLVS